MIIVTPWSNHSLLDTQENLSFNSIVEEISTMKESVKNLTNIVERVLQNIPISGKYYSYYVNIIYSHMMLLHT